MQGLCSQIRAMYILAFVAALLFCVIEFASAGASVKNLPIIDEIVTDLNGTSKFIFLFQIMWRSLNIILMCRYNVE